MIGAVSTSTSQSVQKYSAVDGFDSRTLLNYLLTRTPSFSELNTATSIAVATHKHQIQHQTQRCPHHFDCSASPSIERHSEDYPPVNGYNFSVESGVVMDADHHDINGRKISDCSNNLSQGSHSYIDIGRTTITCSCSECKVHRERLLNHSLRAYSKELNTVEVKD